MVFFFCEYEWVKIVGGCWWMLVVKKCLPFGQLKSVWDEVLVGSQTTTIPQKTNLADVSSKGVRLALWHKSTSSTYYVYVINAIKMVEVSRKLIFTDFEEPVSIMILMVFYQGFHHVHQLHSTCKLSIPVRTFIAYVRFKTYHYWLVHMFSRGIS